MKLTIEELQAISTDILKDVIRVCEENKITYFLAYGSVIGAIRNQGPIPWDSDIDIIVPMEELSRFLETLRGELSDKFYVDYYDVNEKYYTLFPRIGLKGYSTSVLHIDTFMLIGAPSTKKEQKKFIKKIRLFWFLMKIKLRSKEINRNLTQSIVFSLLKLVTLPVSAKKIKNKFDALCHEYPYKTADFVMNATEGYAGKELVPKDFYGKGIAIRYGNIEAKVPAKYKDYLQHFYGDYMKLPPAEERETEDFYLVNKLKKNINSLSN